MPTRNTTFAEVPNVPNWKDFSPRFGVAYDLFGTGRTALKGTFNKYLFGPDLIVFTRLANPVGAIATSATRTWSDANGDFVPQVSELGALSARDFGSPDHQHALRLRRARRLGEARQQLGSVDSASSTS